MNDYARHWNGDVLLSGGTFTESFDEVEYVDNGYVENDYYRNDFVSYEFLTPESNVEVIYDGNEFIQPGYERIGEELVGLDLLENVRIRVQQMLQVVQKMQIHVVSKSICLQTLIFKKVL